MKVVLVSSSSGSRGGGEFYLRELAVSLSGLGHQTTTWLSKHVQMDPLAAAFRQRGLLVHRFDYLNTYQRRLRNLSAATDSSTCRRLADEFAGSGADLLHINQQCLEDGLDLIRAAACCRLPAVSTIHVTRSARSLGARLGAVRDFISRFTLRHARVALIGISQSSASDLGEFVNGHRLLTEFDGSSGAELHPLNVPVYAVPNGVAVPSLRDRQALRSSLGICSEDVVLGVIARIEHQKNPLFMCRLLAALPQNVHCVWVGDGRLRHELEAEITRLGLKSRFHLTGWQDEASGWLSAFDVFALGSLYEGLPLALLEAKAAGLPCAVSMVDGTRDAVQHGVDGYLCPVDDVNVWLSAVNPLIASHELRNRLGQAARQRYEREFSLEAMARRTVTVYEDVIRRSGEKREARGERTR